MQTGDGEQGFARLRPPAGVELSGSAARHQPDQFVLVGVLGCGLGDHPAVLDDHDAGGQLGDLGEPVRDVDDEHAALLEPPDQREQRLKIAAGEDRRRLVQDEHLRLAALGDQRLGDLHHLLAGDGERARPGTRVDGAVADGLQQVAGAGMGGAPVDEAAEAAGEVPHEQVLGDGQLGDQGQFLVDGADAVAVGVVRRAQLDALPVQP
ncbi:hypothetical protein HY68_31705 [Streptomyces sp. AcH 505]|nr:hypothetical protein HY68_31705 [Streptomyces sp. AcH 505]